MYNIKFKFEQKGLEPVTISNVEPNQSILEIALKNDINLHHNCGGVCACSTCHIYVLNGGEHMEDISVREKHFTARSINPGPNSRLACQCLLISEGGEVEVVIP